MNIWYLNHYATPPPYGVSGRPYSLAINLERLSHKVTVICASFHHLRQQAAPPDDHYYCHNYDGVHYYHLPVRHYRGNGLGRMMNMLDFSKEIKQLFRKIDCGELARPDIMIPSCVHPLVFPPAYWLAKKYDAKLIYEVRDIWPLSLVELSGVSSMHPVVLWFQWIEKRAYRHANAVVSLLPNALQHMVSLGLDERKFYFIPNGINRKEWESPLVTLPEEHQKVFQQLKDQGKLIVLYAGAHGPPNALDQVLDLARLGKGQDRPYHFVLIGEGVEKEKLMQRVKEGSITFVTFLPRISKQQVISALNLADVCFIGWQKKMIYKFGTSPNKLCDYFMSAKPVLNALDATDNDPVRKARAGIIVEPYNALSLEDALQRFCAMSEEERKEMGENGQRYAMKNLDWEVLGKQYVAICESLHDA
ncbi:MAG: putative glycosyl transferase [Syntrophorhabdus sp. PtaU1.Bin153]|nr:MAG: putative glycosyl transferase [Syntrophorhabdus sp. PtaU1.Bin153]